MKDLCVQGRFSEKGRARASSLPTAETFPFMLSVGYASQDDRLPWSEAHYLAMLAMPGPGGPIFIGAGYYFPHKGIPACGGKWFPLRGDGEDIVMNGKRGEYADVLGAISFDQAFASTPAILLPPADSFYDWLGLLTEVEEHQDGFLLSAS